MNSFFDNCQDAKNLSSAPVPPQTGVELKPFVSDPVALSKAEKSELVFRYCYCEESAEHLAIEFRLTPSKLSDWLENHGHSPVDLTDNTELEKLEAKLESDQRVQAVVLSGAMLNNTLRSWEKIAATEQNILEVLKKASESFLSFDVVDPKALSALTKAHTAMVKQQLEVKSMLEDSDNSGGLPGLLAKKLQNLFTEIDNLSVV